MLVITSSVRMLYGIFCHTTNLWPAVTLDGILVVGTSGLQQGLVGTTSSGNNSDLSTDAGRDGLLTSGWKSKLGGSLVFVVGDNNGVGTGATSESTTITSFGFDVADDGSLGDRCQGQDVTAGKTGLLPAVDELSTVHTFGTEEQFIVPLVSVSVQELDLADRGTSTGVVKNFLDGSSDVSLLLGVIERSELHGTLSGTGVSVKDRRLTLSLCLLLFI
jgi:hypothetical protein